MGNGRGSWRLTLIAAILASSAIALILRLGYLQIVKHDDYRQKAEEEHWSKQTIVAQRGAIRDRNGHLLSTTVVQFKVFAEPSKIKGEQMAASVAKRLSPLLGMEPERISAILSRPSDRPILLKDSVPYDKGAKISSMYLSGIKTEEVVTRAYPEGTLAAPLIGFVGRDCIGLTGLEADLNRELEGKAGTAIFERDSMGSQIPVGLGSIVPPEEGADLVLTIDRFIQRTAEKELDKAIEKHKASGGTIIIMEPYSGQILALASRPTFDLTKLDLTSSAQMGLYRNRAITDMYEPGSVMKVVTVSAALEEKVINPNSTFYCKGSVSKYGAVIRTWNGQAHGTESVIEILKHSCNVGAVWVSDLLGKEKFYQYIQKFGFGQPTNVGLAGESGGKVRTYKDKDWWPIDLSTNSFGQGISVTPLQMITAVSAVANGGNLMRPYLVKEVVTDSERRTFQPVVVRRVVSEETSRLMRDMLNAAAEKGESKLAIVPGYHISGKTGTASISETGGYSSQDTIASFIGFAPVDNPKFIILVKIDEPKDEPWGSLVASPVFSSLSQQILIYLRVPPTEPNLVGKEVKVWG